MILVVENRSRLMLLEPDDVRDWMGGRVLTPVSEADGEPAESSGRPAWECATPAPPVDNRRRHPAHVHLEPLLLRDPDRGPMWCEDPGVLAVDFQDWLGVDAVREARYALEASVVVPYSTSPAGLYRLETPSMYLMDDTGCLDCGVSNCGSDCAFPNLMQ